MNKRLLDLRNVAAGLALGVAVTLAMGQAPAAAPHTAARYQITAFRGQNNNLELIVLDHQTNRVYHRVEGFIEAGATVEQLLKH